MRALHSAAVLDPDEALGRILETLRPVQGTERVPIEGASGRVLAEVVRSDVDLPPFEKSAMDGFAVRAADFEGRTELDLPILGESRAGAPWGGVVEPGTCAAIYTGAELPAGADAVVVVEKSSAPGRGRVRLADRPSPGQHVCHRGQDLGVGQLVLEPGRRLRAADLSVLAAVGCDPVPVRARPRVAVWTTGDELVAPGERPGPGQIREGNTLHLAALSRAAGAEVVSQGIVRDDPAALERRFRAALEDCDALITTGGVSMGKYDLVGEALERAGCERRFHKVAIKPGKPLWFGTFAAAGGAGGARLVPVFGLPGNPVSCLVNHAVFVAPALAELAGEDRPRRPLERGRWGGAATRENPREQHLPVRLVPGEDGAPGLEPVRWNGSADVVGIARAEALAVVPRGAVLAPGELASFRRLA